MNNLVHIVGLVYGVALVLASVVNHPVTAALRVDALFLPQATERTRPLNLIFGGLVAGYATWSLLTGA